jgi:elongation factor G
MTTQAKIFPVFCGSSLGNIGVQLLLDGVVAYLPSPKDVGHVIGHKQESDETVDLLPDPDGSFLCISF